MSVRWPLVTDDRSPDAATEEDQPERTAKRWLIGEPLPSDKLEGQPNGAAALMLLFSSALPVTFPLTEPVNYEPSFEDSVMMKASGTSVPTMFRSNLNRAPGAPPPDEGGYQ